MKPIASTRAPEQLRCTVRGSAKAPAGATAVRPWGSILPLTLPLLLLAGCSNADAKRAADLQNTPSAGQIAIQENDMDVGTIRMSDGNREIPFTFRNIGGEPVVLIEGATSCMCTEANVKSSDGAVSPRIKMPGHGPVARIYQVMEPGEEAELIVTFNPNAHGPQGVGPLMRDIVLKTNSTLTPNVTFRFRGNVIP